MAGGLHKPGPHESAHLHVTGSAKYVADDPGPQGTLFVLPVPSPIARGRIISMDLRSALAVDGVHCVLTVDDIPGDNIWGPILHNEPLLADGVVHYMGQAIAIVVAETEHSARCGAQRVELEFEEQTPIIGIESAIAANAFHTDPHIIERGDLEAAFESASMVIDGVVETPAQDHFYLETQAALAIPEENGGYTIRSSTQHPTEIQKVVAAALGIGAHHVVCEVPRLGGGFGGKESQASPYAAYAALAAARTGRPCRSWLHRGQDMAWTGKRHPFRTDYEAAFDENGMILGVIARLYSDGGWSLDLSGPVLDRALFHVDSSYFIPAIRVEGRVCSTNIPSNTAFRGFGGPQGMFVMEEILNRAADAMGVDSTELRRRNFYGEAPRDTAPYGQVIEANRLPQLVPQLMEESNYAARKRAIEQFNQTQQHVKRGIGFQPVKFGISFTASLLNQAGALVHVYTDGTVQINHGGTEMGQGLHTKMIAVAADTLGVKLDAVRLMTTATDKVPNTSATAASSGSDLNGAAVQGACLTILERLRPIAAQLLGDEAASTSVTFRDGCAWLGHESGVPFAKVATAAWAQQISLSSTGYYATPGIGYDPSIGRGRPFFYYAFGGAISEVEVNGLTGEYRVRRVDILHDVGNPLAPSIDVGQVEGGFVQGMGWLTCEAVLYSPQGRLLTHGPSTYKIPAAGDTPLELNVSLLRDADNPLVIGGSKAVGEPPFMLAISVISALRDAIRTFGKPGSIVELGMPATPEAVLRAIEHQRIESTAGMDKRHG